MNYLAARPHMAFFAVEFEYYVDSAGRGVLVTRTAFVPPWASEQGESPQLPPGFNELIARMDEVRQEMGLREERRRTGWNYLPARIAEGVPFPTSGVGVYETAREAELNLAALRDLGHDDIADEIQKELEEISGRPASDNWPSISCTLLLNDWPRTRAKVIEPYFRARGESAQ
jgi:hypothetical protein